MVSKSQGAFLKKLTFNILFINFNLLPAKNGRQRPSILQGFLEVPLELITRVSQALVKGMGAFPGLSGDKAHCHRPFGSGPGFSGGQEGPARRQAALGTGDGDPHAIPPLA